MHVNASEELGVGDAIKLRAELTQPSGILEQVFMIKITNPENKKPSNKPGDTPDDRLGLPKPVMVYKEPRDDSSEKVMTWEKLDESGIDMSHETVVHPRADEDGLGAVYVNMDSTALLNYRSSLKTAEATSVADVTFQPSIFTPYFYSLSPRTASTHCTGRPMKLKTSRLRSRSTFLTYSRTRMPNFYSILTRRN